MPELKVVTEKCKGCPHLRSKKWCKSLTCEVHKDNLVKKRVVDMRPDSYKRDCFGAYGD